jgi:hypothetical protein
MVVVSVGMHLAAPFMRERCAWRARRGKAAE